MFELVGGIPRHQYIYIDSSYTHKKSIGFLPAVWFGIVSYHGRAWGCNVLLESGAVYRNLPPHSVSFKQYTEHDYVPWDIEDSQTWDCYGDKFSTVEYPYLSGLECKIRTRSKQQYDGEYLFTVAPIGDGFSAYPEQTKEFSFIKLHNGRLSIQPTNHVLFRERSFTNNHKWEWPTDLKRQTEVYSVE